MPELPPVHRWEVSSPRGLVHIVHGMAEYGARYARLAAALNAAGYTVWAHDHCGHGDHMRVDDGARLPGHFGDSDGWQRLLDDTTSVSQALQASSPGTPLLLFAHSMGSFVGQALLSQSGDRYRGVVLCGSNRPPGPLERAGIGVARLERRLRGPRTPSRWFQRVVFETYNRLFAPTRTEVDWLSRDAAEVDAYVADPLCGFPLTTQAWLDFLGGKSTLGDAPHLRRIPKALPVRLIAGDKDPVGEQGAGVRRLFDIYRETGLTHVSLQLYPNARHELVNETNRDEVTTDLIAWFEQVIAGLT
ncbi:alpha/beta fold hydrolase [Luteitalea pratensis]|nr:alpha/beta hydrolase [Luteitalea pratensis]